MQLANFFGNSGSKIIYQRMSRSNYTGAKLKNKLNIPLILEYNGSEVWSSNNWGHAIFFTKLAAKAELLSLKSADIIVTVSDILADEIVEKGIKRSKIIVYPNCVDSMIFDPDHYDKNTILDLRSKLNISSSAIVFGFIGTFGAWHGIEFLCNTIRELVDRNKSWLDSFEIKFLIVGDGHHREFVEDLTKDTTYSEYIIWPGLVEQTDAPQYLAVMDVLLSPHVPNLDGTKFFGSPTKLFEYMSMNKPIIAADLEQISEVLSPSLKATELPKVDPCSENKETAVLISPANKDQMINAMLFLAEKKEWRKLLAFNARQKALSKYQWDNHVKEIISGIDKYRF